MCRVVTFQRIVGAFQPALFECLWHCWPSISGFCPPEDKPCQKTHLHLREGASKNSLVLRNEGMIDRFLWIPPPSLPALPSRRPVTPPPSSIRIRSLIHLTQLPVPKPKAESTRTTPAVSPEAASSHRCGTRPPAGAGERRLLSDPTPVGRPRAASWGSEGPRSTRDDLGVPTDPTHLRVDPNNMGFKEFGLQTRPGSQV